MGRGLIKTKWAKEIIHFHKSCRFLNSLYLSFNIDIETFRIQTFANYIPILFLLIVSDSILIHRLDFSKFHPYSCFFQIFFPSSPTVTVELSVMFHLQSMLQNNIPNQQQFTYHSERILIFQFYTQFWDVVFCLVTHFVCRGRVLKTKPNQKKN